MTGPDVHGSDFSSLDAGKLLPGCSIPIGTNAGAESSGTHAFAEFQPLPIDGLSRRAISHLADSMSDVARSIERLHQSGRCYGRITSTSFHNRGTSAAPEATLWIDPALAARGDSVHSGDAEAMYWTAERLQSGDPAKPSDDWYAFGIVLAEITLSSTAVHKIWELSRSDGKFVPQLLKNLRRARVDRSLKAMAITLIRSGAAGEVDDATITRVITRQSTGSRKAIFAVLTIMPIALLIAAVNLYQTAKQRDAKEQQLSGLIAQTEELQRRIDELVSRPPAPISPPVVAAVPSTPDTGERDRKRWAEQFAGRPLEEAVAMSESFQPTEWQQPLAQLLALPGQRQWRITDRNVRRSVQQVVDAPWDRESYLDAAQQIASLNEAYARWLAWSRSSKTVEELRTQHDLMPSGLIKESLGGWLAEALELRSFDLSAQVRSAGEDNEFLAHVIGIETPQGSKSQAWTWESPDGNDESISLAVEDYRVGDSVSVWLQQDSSIPYWDKTVIEHQFESPLLVWQLGRGLKLQDSESGYAILLTTDKRFGPPVRLDSGTQTQASSHDASHDSAVGRKVVDPVNDLPFDLE